MEGECMVLVDATVDTESRNKATLQRVKPGSSHRSTFTTALLVFTLCLASAAAAVLLFNNHSKGPEQQEDSFDLHHTLRQIANIRAAIHLEGNCSYDQKTIHWKENVDHYHAQDGLRLVNNEIVIPQRGLYFVYSQASFRVSCSSSTDEYDDDDDEATALVHLSHTVQRWSDLYREYRPILHSVRTACQKTVSDNPDEHGRWFSAVYMGAVFNLSEGDKLRTVTNSKMLPSLEDDPGKTFFGVFAL